MQVNWPGPHTPFIVTQEMMESTATRPFNPPVDYFFGPNSEADNIVARRLYAAEVENLDGWFAQYIHATQQLGDARDDRGDSRDLSRAGLRAPLLFLNARHTKCI